MIETSATIVALTGAILKVQGSVDSVKKDKVNPHFKNRYATLENVIDTARPALQEAGIAFVQAPGQVLDGSVEVTTMLVHESGEWMRSTLHVPLGKRDAQGVGSAITYGCRYSLMAMLGLPPTDDDDGQAASAPYHPPAKSEPPRKANGRPEKGWREDGTRTPHSLREEGWWKEFEGDLKACESVSDLTKVALHWSAHAEKEKWPAQWKTLAKVEINAYREAILHARPPAEDDASAIDQRMRDERAALAQHPVNGG
jgi:hypothetical protein